MNNLLRSLVLCVAALSGIFFLTNARPLQCEVAIISPKSGERVREDGLAKGTAKIPHDAYLWVLARKRGLVGWWPQGGGSAELIDGEWNVLVKYGVPGELGQFEIAVVVVNAQASEDLDRWVASAPTIGYPPIRFPSPASGCLVKRVIVEKVAS